LLRAPSVKSIVHTVLVSRGPRGGESRTVVVSLASPPPAGTSAIVLYPAGKAPGAGVSWVSIAGFPPATEYSVYNTPGRCSFHVPGMSEVPAGSRATIAWVDSSGRVSPRSKEFVVGKGAPSPNMIAP
jgi:hypothetical protein